MQISNEDMTFNNYYLQNLSNQPIDLSVTNMTKTLNCDTTTTTLSPTNSSSSHDFSPKNSSMKKPIRRRSRASKKTPTTHLSADASNFRALVQQFTGCHTANTFLGAHKGPINLNFGLDENEDFDADNSITVSSFGYDCYCNPKEQKQHKEKKVEEQKCMLLSVDENRVIGSTSTTNSSSSPTMDIMNFNDFELDNLCLNDFTGDLITSTDENIWDDGYLF
ncbi:uncharacterized protein LOC132624429 [Lycium barbarum]|uniref:uncharacterized protein LOC132624429 n=1 Tax=Lycium barbarum TaxID=112863 RepID=UPI00293E9F6B|nr:uncharacterized protein LOC132624429 [Lycium barbarum]